MNDTGITVIAIGAAMVFAAIIVLLIVFVTPPRRYAGQAPKLRRRRPSIFLFYCFYIFLLAAGIGLLYLCGPFFPLGGVFLLVLGGMTVTFLLTGRETLSMHVFSSLGASMRQNLPLTTAMEAEARSLTGQAQNVFQNIAAWLSQGFPLSEAILRGYPRCPGEALSMVKAAEYVGQTPKTIAVIERNISEKMRYGNYLQPMYPSYPIAVIIVSVLIVTMMLYFVVPKFEMIFSDLECRLPAATIWMMQISRVTNEGFVLIPPAMLLLIVPMGLYLRFRPRRPEKPYTLSNWGDEIKWHLPPLHWFERMRAQILTADFLRIALEAGATVDNAVTGACALDLNVQYRNRLNEWLMRIQMGENVSAAARAAKVGTSLAWAFDTDVNPGSTPAVLEAIASAGRINYSHARNVARSIFWPCLTLLMATMIGFIVYAMFIPLTTTLNVMMDFLFT